jgi:hypothetical protein
MTIGRRTGFSEDTFSYGTPCRLVSFPFPGRYPRLPSTMTSPVIVIYETSRRRAALEIVRDSGNPAILWRQDGKLDSETLCNWLLAP